MPSRRDLLKAAAAAASLQTAAAQHQHAAPLVQVAAVDAKPRFFTAAELDAVRVLADIIIPRTDTPGAADAKVHFIIDASLATREVNRPLWRDGLKLVEQDSRETHNAGFAQLTLEQQTALVKRYSEAADAGRKNFFTLLKNAAIDGYYATKEGLATELGWSGNTFLPKFTGCTHPEHQS